MADTKLRVRKATQILQEDHQAVKKLFEDYDQEEGSERTSLFQEIKNLLTVHAQIEAEIFYPAIERSDDERAGELVQEAHEEHRLVQALLDELTRLIPGDASFHAKMKVLQENVLRHAEEEESEIFPLFQHLERAEQDRVSEMLQNRKHDLSGNS
jgi:hemerythrin superfamily protein